MLEKIEKSFRDLISCLQVARLYPEWHPQFKSAIDIASASLKESLQERGELVMGIVGEELVFEKEIFFESSRLAKPMILYLKSRGIERIAFYRGLEREELSRFISFLTASKEKLKDDTQAQGQLLALGIKNIVIGRLGIPSSLEEKTKKAAGYLSIYEDSLNKVNESIETILNEQEIDSLSLQFTVTNVMDSLLGKYQDFLNVATIKRFDLRTFSHLLNVSILSMYFSSKLGFSRQDVQAIGTAALFHDVGKLYISRKIIRKPASLTDEEYSKIKSHVTIGAKILLKYVDKLGVLPVVVCFEHHLKYNLTGYPKIAFYQKPHIASLIASICDVYDALSQRRVYKEDYPPDFIYNIMSRDKGSAFEPGLLDRFFQIIGVWPVGAMVLLNDSRVAVVREENEDDIFCPRVEVIFPQDKKEMIDLKEEKQRFKIERFINPLREGKVYLHLI